MEDDSIVAKISKMSKENECFQREIDEMKKKIQSLDHVKQITSIAYQRTKAENEQLDRDMSRIQESIRDSQDFILKREDDIDEYVHKSISFAIKASIQSEILMKGFEEIEELKNQINRYLPINELENASAQTEGDWEDVEKEIVKPTKEETENYWVKCQKKQQKIIKIEAKIGNSERVMNRFVESGMINSVKQEPGDVKPKVEGSVASSKKVQKNNVSVGDQPGTSGASSTASSSTSKRRSSRNQMSDASPNAARRSSRSAALKMGKENLDKSKDKVATNDEDGDSDVQVITRPKKEVKEEVLISDDENVQTNDENGSTQDDKSKVKKEVKSEPEESSDGEDEEEEEEVDSDGEQSDSEDSDQRQIVVKPKIKREN